MLLALLRTPTTGSLTNGAITASGSDARGVVFSPNSFITNNNTIETLGNLAS